MRKARRDLAHHKWPFLALTAMIVLGVASFTSIYGAYANLQDAVDGTYASQNFHDALLEIKPTARASLASLDDAAGVHAWEARLFVELPVTFNNGEPPVMARIISLPATGDSRIDVLRVLDGATPGERTSDVVLDAGFAGHHDLKVGDIAHVTTPTGTRSVRIAGTALSPEYLWPAKTAQEHMPDVLRRWGVFWIREDSLQTLIQQPDVVNQVVLDAPPGASADDAIRGAVAAVSPDAVLRSETREKQASNVVLGLLVNAVSQMAYVLPLLFLSVVGLSTHVLLTRLILQQRANIGLLRALGYAPRTILLHYLAYAPLLAGLGAVAGFALGYAISHVVTGIFGSYVSLTSIPVRLRLDLLLVGFGLSLAFAGAASILPAHSASRLRPSEAMRPPVPPRGSRSLLERAFPRAPPSVRLGLRNVARNPRRSGFTILGVALAVSVLVIPQGVVDSLNNVTEIAVVRVQQADEILILKQPARIAQIEQTTQIQGVALAEPLIQLQVGFRREGTTRDVTIMGLAPTSLLMRLADEDGAPIRTSDEGIILSRVFERDGIRVGDTLALYGEAVRVLAFTQASGTSGFVALSTAQRWAATPDAANQVMIKRESGASRDEVHARIAEALPVGATLDVPQAIQDTRDMLRLYYAMVYLILAFGIAIGAAIVFNTVTINVLEESRDFATLRTLGVSMRSLAAQTTTETLALAIPGAVLGLGMGALLARYFVGVFSSDLFVLDLHLRPFTLVTAFALGVLVALLAQVPSIRYVGRLDLAKAARERAA